MTGWKTLIAALCCLAAFGLTGCGGGAQSPEEAKTDEQIQQQAPELQEGA